MSQLKILNQRSYCKYYNNLPYKQTEYEKEENTIKLYRYCLEL